MSETTRAPNPNPFLSKAKKAAKAADPINYGEDFAAAKSLVDDQNRSEERRKADQNRSEERRKADLGFLSAVLDRFGLDTAVIKTLGAKVVARIGQSIDRDNSLQDEGRRMNQLRQLEIDLRYAGRSEAADAIALRIADALAAKL